MPPLLWLGLNCFLRVDAGQEVNCTHSPVVQVLCQRFHFSMAGMKKVCWPCQLLKGLPSCDVVSLILTQLSNCAPCLVLPAHVGPRDLLNPKERPGRLQLCTRSMLCPGSTCGCQPCPSDTYCNPNSQTCPSTPTSRNLASQSNLQTHS